MCRCGFDVVMVRPKRVPKQIILISRRILLVQDGPEYAIAAKNLAARWLWNHFGATLVPLWGHFGYMMLTLGHFGTTVGSSWSHFRYMKVHFQKTILFPTYFNDFIKGVSELGIDWGLFWDVFWHMMVTLGPFRGHFGLTLGI